MFLVDMIPFKMALWEIINTEFSVRLTSVAVGTLCDMGMDYSD